MEITIISDRDPGIITAVRNVFGSERHAYCYRHVKENLSKEFGRLIRGKTRVKAQQKEDDEPSSKEMRVCSSPFGMLRYSEKLVIMFVMDVCSTPGTLS